MQFRIKGGSSVDSGTYWNFETGEKVKMAQAGILPGKSSQSFFKLPPMLILAFAAAAAHVLLYILPKYLVQFYEPYTEKLVTAYVIIDYIAVGVVLAALAAVAIRDIFGLTLKVPAFTWNPAETHLEGKRHIQNNDKRSVKEEKKADEAEKK